MDTTTRNWRHAADAVALGPVGDRRTFLKTIGVGVLGASGGIGALDLAAQVRAPGIAPLWDSAQVLIGHSLTDQAPRPTIECPLFFEYGGFAQGRHTLDLSHLPQVRGTITLGADTIEPDFGPSVAAATVVGTDGMPYLVVAGEAQVADGRRRFRDVTRVIVRCKYRVSDLS